MRGFVWVGESLLSLDKKYYWVNAIHIPDILGLNVGENSQMYEFYLFLKVYLTMTSER